MSVSVLKSNPTIPASMFRPMLKESLPCNFEISAKYIDNFRRRVAIHHAKYPDNPTVSMEQCKALSSSGNLSEKDFIGLNDPIVRVNMNKLYANILQTDNNVWSALNFLNKCKESIPGFDYRILKARAGNPTALLYMTSRMRYNLIRYGNIMFIDGQKRQLNKLNWPYIGPVIRNGDNRIGVTCKAIVTSEDNDTYTWIFQSMKSIEPRWSPSEIQILYADQLVSKKLLENLNISDTCILHGDYYHLFKENWPKPENFGTVVFRKIKPQLSKMLTCRTKLEWDTAFNEAKELITEHPLKLELLNKIHSNPDYYAGYVTRDIIGNLGLNGTSHAEQNHSSIVRCCGEYMLGSVLNHLKLLMERQQQICNKENNYESDHVVRSNHYRPTLDGEMGFQEKIAFKALSPIAFESYFVKQLKSSELLQSAYDDDLLAHRVWPAGVPFNENDKEHIVIKVGDRCNCWRRVDFDIQCKHELKLNVKFKENYWGQRWLNRMKYNKLYPEMSTFHSNTEVIEIDNSCNNQSNVSEAGNQVTCGNDRTSEGEEEEDFVFNTILEKKNSKVTYNDVLEISTDLCRTVSHDPKLCRNTYATIFEWITKLREGKKFDICFNNKLIPKPPSILNKDESAQAAIITPVQNTRKRRSRYKSRQEINRSKIGRINNFDDDSEYNISDSDIEYIEQSQISGKSRNMTIDENCVLLGSSNKRYCFLCRQPHCTRWTCNVLKSYEKVPGRQLVKGNQEVRDELISLIATTNNQVLCYNRDVDDERIVYNELPKKIKALIVSKKYIIGDNISQISQKENVCVECTLLGEFGKPMEKYTDALFKKICIIRHIGKSKNNLVVNNL